MNVSGVIQKKSAQILGDAMAGLRRAHLEHYEKLGTEGARERLEALLELTTECIGTRNGTSMSRFAEQLARDRHSAGYGLGEVQTAINVLEEAIWRRMLENCESRHLGEALGLVSTVLGIGKDALARTYVELASKHRAPSLDQKALFRGTEGG